MSNSDNTFSAQINAVHALLPHRDSSLTEACEHHDGGVLVSVAPMIEGDLSGGAEFVAYTCDQALHAAYEAFEGSIWAYRAEFLSRFMPDGMTEEMVAALVATNACEDLNAPFRAMIEAGRGMAAAFSEATSDGFGHLLAHYDHEEHEGGDNLEFLIYRIS